MAKQRIGILGGAFDPIHCGHLGMARCALESAGLDRILVMPAGLPAYRQCEASPEDRWKMVVAACRGDSALVPSRLDLDRDGPVYSADTAAELRRLYPDAKIYWILGADSLMRLRSWRRAEDLFRVCRFLAFERPGAVRSADLSAEISRLSQMGANIRLLPMETVPVSSGEIRRALSEGREPDGLDLCVREFIACRGLYGSPVRIPASAAWLNRLFLSLKPRRFAHSLAVADTARRMAARFGEDPFRAEEAGLLHDCAKNIPLNEMQRIARENRLTDDSGFLSSTALLHSVVGSWVARHDYGMDDPAVLEAIAYHNTGHAGMSRLAMCVCLADSIEPTRSAYPLLDRVRAVAESSLEKALLLSLEGTAEYVSSKGYFLHPRTQETIAWLKTLPAVQS